MSSPIDGWDVRLIDFGLAKMVGMKQEEKFFGGMVSMKRGLRLENVEEVEEVDGVDGVDGVEGVSAGTEAEAWGGEDDDVPFATGGDGDGDGDVTEAGDDAVPLYEMTAGPYIEYRYTQHVFTRDCLVIEYRYTL